MTTAISALGACCPITLGEVCWDNGVTTGRAFAVYDPSDGTTSFVDQLTGSDVPVGQIIACPAADNTVEVANDWATVNGVVSHIVANAAGNIVAGKESVTFTNVGTTAGTVAGANIAPGETITFTAYADPVTRQFKRVPAIAYVASATALLSISWMD